MLGLGLKFFENHQCFDGCEVVQVQSIQFGPDLLEQRILHLDHTQLQLSMIQMQDPLLEEIRSELDGLDLNNLTPIEALMVLKELQAKTKQS